jgi:hypothetical protein
MEEEENDSSGSITMEFSIHLARFPPFTVQLCWFGISQPDGDVNHPPGSIHVA